MKLWFEGWNVNAHDALPRQSFAAGRHRRADQRDKYLAVTWPRGDSAANDFRPKM
jgi:hypothetical protein